MVKTDVKIGGLELKNPVMTASGTFGYGLEFADFVDLNKLGGFIVKGTTLNHREGNAYPRSAETPMGMLNAVGLQNKGVDYFAANIYPQLKDLDTNVLVNVSGACIEDYVACAEKVAALDKIPGIELNISCPNVVGLTALQDISFLSEIVDKLLALRMYYDEYRPILLKVSPDLSHQQLDEIIDYSLRSGIDGIVAGNTTRSRDGLTSISQEKIEEIGNGGMSGAPIYQKNLALVKYVHEKSGGKLPIVGVGGIMSPEQAQEMLEAGASLIEIYSGFIYEGPSLIKRIIKHLENLTKA